MDEYIINDEGSLELEIETNKMTYQKTYQLEDYHSLEAMFNIARVWYYDRIAKEDEYIIEEEVVIKLEVETNKMIYKKIFELQEYHPLESIFNNAKRWYYEQTNWEEKDESKFFELTNDLAGFAGYPFSGGNINKFREDIKRLCIKHRIWNESKN